MGKRGPPLANVIFLLPDILFVKTDQTCHSHCCHSISGTMFGLKYNILQTESGITNPNSWQYFSHYYERVQLLC